MILFCCGAVRCGVSSNPLLWSLWLMSDRPVFTLHHNFKKIVTHSENKRTGLNIKWSMVWPKNLWSKMGCSCSQLCTEGLLQHPFSAIYVYHKSYQFSMLGRGKGKGGRKKGKGKGKEKGRWKEDSLRNVRHMDRRTLRWFYNLSNAMHCIGQTKSGVGVFSNRM